MVNSFYPQCLKKIGGNHEQKPFEQITYPGNIDHPRFCRLWGQ
jgi:hypothetical protein